MTGKHRRKHRKWGKGYNIGPLKGSVVICRSPALHLLHQEKPRSGATSMAYLGEMALNEKWISTPLAVDFYFEGGRNTHEGKIVGVQARTIAKVEWK